MKIVYCLPQLYRPGGIERIVSIKANYLADIYNYEVIIIVADQRGKPSFYNLSKKVKVIDLGLPYDDTISLPLIQRLLLRYRFHNFHKRKLSRLLMEIRPDITVSTFTHEASFLPKIKDGSKKVLEFHFCRGHKRLMADSFNYSFIKRCFYYFRCWEEENIIIPRYDQFVVLTEEDRILWKNKIKNVVCIPNILPFETKEQAELLYNKVIAVGRLDAQKSFDRLIKAWTFVHKKVPSCILEIYGQGMDESKLNTLIKNEGLDKVVFICSPISEIKSKYLESSVFVMTSRYEGLPMTLLEATSLGIPSVCLDFRSGPHDVIINESSGYIVKDDNLEEFANRVVYLIQNFEERRKMGLKAKEISEKYSSKCVMEKWNGLFHNMTNEKL